MPGPDRLYVRAHAKLNLHLEVVEQLADGYHRLRTIFCSLGLADEVYLRRRRDGRIRLRQESPLRLGWHRLSASAHRRLAPPLRFVAPAGGENIAWQAAVLLQEYAKSRLGADLVLRKRIPLGSGLAGGSADAAAVLRGLNHLWDLHLESKELAHMAGKLGADVPFCLQGGLALGEGRGDRLSSLQMPLPHLVMLIHPGGILPTTEVYRTWDQLEAPSTLSTMRPTISRPHSQGAWCWRNDLERAAFVLYPVLQKVKEALAGLVRVQLSGSGPTFFVPLYDSSLAVVAAVRSRLRRLGVPLCYTITKPCDHGLDVCQKAEGRSLPRRWVQ